MSPAVAHAVSVSLLGLYLLVVERNRMGATSMTLLGLLIMYGFGFWYFVYVVPDLVEPVVARMQYVLALGSAMFIVGAEAVRWCTAGSMPEQRRMIRNWSATPISTGGAQDHWLAIIAIAAASYMVLVMFSTGKISGLSSYFSQASEEVRSELRRTQVPGGYLYGLLLMSFGPFLSAIVLLRAVARRSPLLTIAATALCCAVFLGRFAALTKSLWVIYLVQLVLTFYAARSLQLPLVKALTTVLLMLTALFVGSWLAFPEAPAQEIFTYLLYRMVQITNEGIYQTLYVYPDFVPFSEGLNIGLLASIAGYDVPAQAYTTVANFFGAFGATFNTMFMSGAWVDFGWMGVAVVSFVVGASVRFYDYLTLSLGKSALGCAMVGFAVIPADQLMATSAQTALLSGGLLSVPLLVLIVRPLVRVASSRVLTPTSEVAKLHA